MANETPLDIEIRRRIRVAGPMPLRQFMTLCLADPQHGYYMTRDPLGSAGDFTTAPEISQMFGELLGIWAASVWKLMGSPNPCRLVELGPGRGSMMRDALRVTKIVPGLADAVIVDLVETSPVLRRLQQDTLATVELKAGRAIQWHNSLREVPRGPMILLANEFFDALPINQAVKQADGWHERVVDLVDDRLTFALAPDPLPMFAHTLPRALQSARDGEIVEWRADHTITDIANRIVADGGAALIVDYGHGATAAGDTFQAVRAHRPADPLSSPGLLDLTAHVDFAALATAAERPGARIYGPVLQADFLERLGIAARAEALKANASPAQADDIDTALERLTSRRRLGMGALFKVLAVCHPVLDRVPGFDA